MPQPKPTITLRRPIAPVPLSVAESFVRGDSEPSSAAHVEQLTGREESGAGGADISADPASAVETQRTGHLDIRPMRPGIVQRRSGRVRRRTTVYLEPGLATRLAVYCATYGFELSQVAEAAILAHLDSLERPNRPSRESSAAG